MPTRCPDCSSEIPSDAPAGLCPKCLYRAGFPSSPKATEPSPHAANFAAPTVEQLAPYFPHYEISELIGKGGMGAVYKARFPSLDRFVAIKILPASDPLLAERFQREAKALARLSHPHIVAVHDVGSAGPWLYMVMEFVDGVNLRQVMRAGTMTPAQALAIVPQMCDALQYAHDEGIVHRDIKPENVLLDKKGRVKIADFGLAKMLGNEGVDPMLTGSYQVMGTLRYMAPEQMLGTRDVDHRADIYSLGVVFYELLTGELPLGRFAPPSKKVQIDVRLDEVVLRALEQKPEQRYQQASQVKSGMEAICGPLPPALQRALGHEYKSKTTIFGIPLLHITSGIDPRTGKTRVARGIIAFGDIAVGGLAMGGLAIGGIAFGGVSLGVISLGGLALGIVAAIGGCSIGGVIAFGGLAISSVALGGMAVGYYAYGGGVLGVHTMSGAGGDPAAERLFMPWADRWTQWVTLLAIVLPLASVVMYGLVWLLFWNKYRNEPEQPIVAGFPRAPRGSLAKLSAIAADAWRSWEARWRATPNIIRQAVHIFLALVYVAGLLCFFSFSGGSEKLGEGKRMWMKVGQPTPWLEMESHSMGFRHELHLLTWAIPIAIGTLLVLALARRLEEIEKGRAHSMWWHYAIWMVMLGTVIAIGMTQHFLGVSGADDAVIERAYDLPR